MRWDGASSVTNKRAARQWCARRPSPSRPLGWLRPPPFSRRVILWHYSTRWFSLHAQSVLVLHLVGFLYPWPQPGDTPSPRVIPDAAEVRWSDITSPGSQSGASGPAGLPPSLVRIAASSQRAPESKHMSEIVWCARLCMCHVWLGDEHTETVLLWSSGEAAGGREGERGEDLFIERQQFFNWYCLCLKRVIFLCKAWRCCSAGRYFNA